ncbi:efflux RND transporter periplasmic adaptor subunit [Saccharospirillum impatiens]|uniref:efflux RND transporter periplasmic adaptor subunit n=1 Tax=Saccharospirillum impatiens TaxID=169438 RepID=UPI0003FBE9BE|nr:biotin/lipoyl-binding protein [Saccharospirillum impatiens]
MSSRWIRLSLPLVVLGAGVAVAFWMNSQPDSSVADAEQVEADPLANAATVATAAPDFNRWSPQLQLYSQYQSRQSVLLTSPTAADVLSVSVEAGQRVEAGALLVQLDARHLQRQVTQLQARRNDLLARIRLEQTQHASNQAALSIERDLVSIAQRTVERLQNLARQNLSSATDLEAAERTLQNQRLALQQRELAISRYSDVQQQLEAQLAELDSQLDQALNNLADAEIRAPFSGRVSAIDVDPGATVGAGSVLLRLTNDRQTQWVARAASSTVASLGNLQGLSGWVETDGQRQAVDVRQQDPGSEGGSIGVYFQRQGDATEPATLNRYYRLWLDLPAIDAFRVPDASVYSNGFVYRVADNRLQRVAVTVLGEQFTEGEIWRLIDADLDASDRILTTRLRQAAQGLAVKVADQ